MDKESENNTNIEETPEKDQSESNSEAGNPLLEQLSKFTKLNAEFKSIPGVKFYLISTKWYKSWLNFIENQGPLPGKIDNSDITDDEQSQDYYFHRRPAYQYANAFLKEEVQELEDFIICTEPAYKFLDDFYSHLSPEIIRYSIVMSDCKKSS
jgi:hypothetical protein